MSQAEKLLADFDKSAAPALAASRRAAKQDAASAGRIGSGMLTTSLGDIESDYERNRQDKEDQLISDALAKGEADKFNRLSAAEGLEGQQFGEGEANRADLQSVQSAQEAEQERELAAELAGQGQQFGRGITLSQLGFGYDPTSALFKGAATNQANAGAAAKSIGDLFGSGAELAAAF